PVFFGLASLLIFRERYSLLQWSGLAILIAGLIAYSHDQLQMLMSSPDQYLLGNTLLALGAFTWAIYALAQKQLLEKLPSTIIMWFIYGICLLLFTPMARPLTILSLNGLELSLLIFSGFNTLIAYGAFSEALEHLEASRVSAILAITPLVTLISVDLLSLWFPAWVAAEPISMIGIIGAILVVVGAIATTMGKQEKVKIEQ
ncbi:MAG: DMT family transporter, partial [Microcoleaceae cyanobacterium]